MTPIVLVVDDSDTDRQMVGGLLKSKTNFEVRFAWDGQDALDCIESSRVDVVVTDLIMPGLDGLELVERVRQSHPHIPMLLMTSFGNEDLAAEALEKGAASYVPKSQVAERLVPAVERLVRRSLNDRFSGQVRSQLDECYLRFTLDNDPQLVSPLLDTLQRTMASLQLGHSVERIRVCTALEEAVSNAIFHGNLEITREELAAARHDPSGQALANLVAERRGRDEIRDRKVSIEAHITRENAKFIVRDQGRGFDLNGNVSSKLEDYFDRGDGRGLILMYSLVDDVQFNDAANEVTLTALPPRS